MSTRHGGKSKDMRLKITGCRHVYTGRNQKGDTYSIYEIDAERAADGVKINQKLRAFDALPIGQIVEVTVTPFISDRHGKSFTLELKNRERGGSAKRLNEMEERLQEMERRSSAQERRIAELETRLGELLRSDASQAVNTPAQKPADPELAAKFGDDAPW